MLHPYYTQTTVHSNRVPQAAKPYTYAYGIMDPYNGLDFAQDESSDGSTVSGSYSVQLPDGRTQTVSINASRGNS